MRQRLSVCFALLLSRVLYFTSPEETNTGPGLNRGFAPGGVASKNGEGHMRVQGGFISYRGDSFPIAAVVCLSAEAAKVAVGLSIKNVSVYLDESRNQLRSLKVGG